MTVETDTNRWTPTGDGSTTDFSYNNRIFAKTDLKVYVDGDLKTITTDYTVSGVGEDAGGNVSFLVAPAAGAQIVIVRDVPGLQPTKFPSGGPLPTSAIEKAVDRLTVLAQQLEDGYARSLHQTSDDEAVGEMHLPKKADRAGKVLGFDADGLPAVTAEDLADIEGAATSAAEAAASASAAATSEVNAADSATAAENSAQAAATAASSNMYASNENKSADFAVAATDDGKQFLIDTSAGAVTVTLPEGADATDGFRVAFAKVTSDDNAVIVNRSGTDTINGGTAWQFSIPYGQSVVTLDTTPSPDTWFAAGVGVASPVGVNDLHENARPYDVAFIAGYDTIMAPENVAERTYAELVMTRSGSFVGEAGYIDTAPTGAAVIVDVEKNGTSIYSTAPQFADGANALTAGTLKTDGTEDFASGDRITFKVTQTGAATAGAGVRFTAKGVII